MTNFIQQLLLQKKSVYFFSVCTSIQIDKVEYALICISTEMTSYYKLNPVDKISNLTRYFFVILPSWVFQPSCCEKSLSFCKRTTLMSFSRRSPRVFENFNFRRILNIFESLYPLHDGRLSKSSHFSNIWCFLKRFFAQNNSNMIKESFFAFSPVFFTEQL